jgi:hypothetical protein
LPSHSSAIIPTCPVKVQPIRAAQRRLLPLTGVAVRRGRAARIIPRPAKGIVAHLAIQAAGVVGGDRRAAQVITQHVVDGAALFHRDSRAARVIVTGRHAVAVLVIVSDVIRRHAVTVLDSFAVPISGNETPSR